MITQILAKVLPVLVMIILGRVCATKGILNDEQHAGLKNVIGDILLPVVLFQAFFTAARIRPRCTPWSISVRRCSATPFS